MRIVISGATGLIGRALTKALLGRGDDVVTLARPGSRALPGTTVSWDPSTPTINMAGLADVGAIDAVVHLAGAGIADKRWTAGRKAEIRESRIAGTSTLATAAANLESTPSVFISGSAIGWYGSRGDEILDEGSSRGDGFLADVCVDWEDASAPAKAAGIRTVLARTGIVLSPKGGALAMDQLDQPCRRGPRPALPPRRRSPVRSGKPHLPRAGAQRGADTCSWSSPAPSRSAPCARSGTEGGAGRRARQRGAPRLSASPPWCSAVPRIRIRSSKHRCCVVVDALIANAGHRMGCCIFQVPFVTRSSA